MSVSVRSEHARGAPVARRLRERARRYLSALGRADAEVSILLVGDAAIRRLNRTWRGKDAPTDVLSFPQPRAGSSRLLGDVVISLDTAARVARGEGRPLGAELDRYLAHGLLHLLGHDHARPAEARRMSAAEDALVGEGMVGASLARRERGPGARRAARDARTARADGVRRARSRGSGLDAESHGS